MSTYAGIHTPMRFEMAVLPYSPDCRTAAVTVAVPAPGISVSRLAGIVITIGGRFPPVPTIAANGCSVRSISIVRSDGTRFGDGEGEACSPPAGGNNVTYAMAPTTSSTARNVARTTR